MNVNGITSYVSPYTSAGRKADKYSDGQFYQHVQGTRSGVDESKQYTSPQEIYEANKFTAYYKGKSLKEWSLTDPAYTDPATGVSWYVRDGKHPYMTGEDAEKFRKLCEESGEFYLKKFAEMTGLIQHLDDNTVAYVGDNGTAIKSKDGKELWIDTSSLSYDMIMNMFRNISKTGNYFDSGYWCNNIWDNITDMQVNMLVSETVQARFPLEEVDEEGNRKEDMYLITVDKDGIHCSKSGQDEYEWEILFTDESQYEKAIEFLNYARKFMDNFRFAAHENFWEDYLNGNMDVDGFKEFLKGTNNGIPDYSFTVGNSMYIDKEKVQWAQYMNPLGAKFYTAEEMAKMQAELIEKNTATLHKLSDPYSILYKKLVDPKYNGERIFCEYPGGPLYTADEIMEVMNRNLKDAKYQAAARK